METRHIAFEHTRLAVHLAGRGPLAVLVHPETGRQKPDHLEHALWMGEVLPLDASVLPD